jgi:hypothetical protein
LFQNKNKFKASLIGVPMLFIASNFLFFETLNIAFFAKFQLYKFSIWLAVFNSIFLVDLLLLNFSVSKYGKKMESKIAYLSVFPIVILILLPFFQHKIPNNKLNSRIEFGNYSKSDLQKLEEWISHNLDKNVLFLLPPDNNTFACRAKRSQLVSFRAIIHKPDFMFQWQHNMDSVYGPFNYNEDFGKELIKKAVIHYNESCNVEKFKTLGIKYRVDNVFDIKFELDRNRIIKQFGDWIVWKI